MVKASRRRRDLQVVRRDHGELTEAKLLAALWIFDHQKDYWYVSKDGKKCFMSVREATEFLRANKQALKADIANKKQRIELVRQLIKWLPSMEDILHQSEDRFAKLFGKHKLFRKEYFRQRSNQ
jgi:hypothetical protein